MKAWLLASTCRTLCTRSAGFMCKLSCGAHVPVGQISHSPLALETAFWPWVSGGGWDVSPLPLRFQDWRFPLMFVLTVCSLYGGCSQGWVSQSTPALASLPGLSLLKLVSATPLPKDAVLKVLPRESSPCPAAPGDQHGHRFLRLRRGRWLSLHICSHSPADLVSWDWPDPGQRLRAAGPGVTAPLRTHCSLQTKAPDGFDHQLCTLLSSFIYLLFCSLFCIWAMEFSDVFWVWAPNVIYALQFFCRLTFCPTDCWRDYPFPILLS